MISFLQELQNSRPLKTAIAVSLLWHLIWLFVITIDMESPGNRPKLEPKIYFVGPILSDAAFNMILAEKPEFSTTVYRGQQSPAAPSLEPQPQAMERAEPGDLVSIPLGQSTWSSLRGHLKSEKPYPEVLFRKKLQPTAVVRPPFPVGNGPLENRSLLSVPAFPELPNRGEVPWVDPEFELTVSGEGIVQEARLAVSSGDPETDRVIERYLKQWQFVPSEESARGSVERGRVRVPADGGRAAR